MLFLLLHLSNSPTQVPVRDIQIKASTPQAADGTEEEQINWVAYLKEGEPSYVLGPEEPLSVSVVIKLSLGSPIVSPDSFSSSSLVLFLTIFRRVFDCHYPLCSLLAHCICLTTKENSFVKIFLSWQSASPMAR